MSGLSRPRSSSDTMMLPMYQNIQGMRLKKMSNGPDSTKKSQKLSGAKIPTKKMRIPRMSRITASDRQRDVHLFTSMADETDK